MAIPVTDPLTITYGDIVIGGDSSYRLNGPYVLDRSYETFRMVVPVVVLATDLDDLWSKCDALETKFSRPLAPQTALRISLGTSEWEYTIGAEMLSAEASILKTGDPSTDRGNSRGYTITITGDLPADTGGGGLRELQVSADADASGLWSVTFRGFYSSTEATDALSNYRSQFDGVANSYLSTIASSTEYGSIAWEIVQENFELPYERRRSTDPRLAHVQFFRQYQQVFSNQSSTKNDDRIADHRVTFALMHNGVGDSRSDIQRLKRVTCNYDAAIVGYESDDPHQIAEEVIKPHIVDLFQSEFSPNTYGLEDFRLSFSPSQSRVGVQATFVYTSNGSDILELSWSCAYREQRNIDYTYLHEDNTLAAVANAGFDIIERVWTRTMMVEGAYAPTSRIWKNGSTAQPFNDSLPNGAGQGDDLSGPDGRDMSLKTSGWNIISNNSQVTPKYIGITDEGEQVLVTVVQDVIVERYTETASTAPPT